MKNVLHKNNLNLGIVQVHVEPPPIPLIKSKNDEKSDKYCAEIKLRRDPTSENSYLYGFKFSLFDIGDPEGLLLFISNFNITPKASGTLVSGAKVQYVRTLVRE